MSMTKKSKDYPSSEKCILSSHSLLWGGKWPEVMHHHKRAKNIPGTNLSHNRQEHASHKLKNNQELAKQEQLKETS